MNARLQSALSELKSAGAQGLPSSSTVESAKDGSSWKGNKSDGSPWKLVKNNTDSYNCMC